jgi:ABC-type dipeptide/oligopeptide/nickel transport system ATPase component
MPDASSNAAPSNEIFYNPQHEYTKGLMASIPGEDARKGNETPSDRRQPGRCLRPSERLLLRPALREVHGDLP